MEKLAEFVSTHSDHDTTRLILDRAKWPDIDIDTAVNCIESRRKLKGKVNEWFNEPRLIFPLKLSAEQCSSSATGRYKAELAKKIAGGSAEDSSFRIADLTGGLGVDSWFFSQKASAVLYNEMQRVLCKAAEHNFKILGAENIKVNCAAAMPSELAEEGKSVTDLLYGFNPDIIYLDPARRGEGGKKVFLIEECTPDVLKLKEELHSISRHILIKLSPMADISLVCNRLGNTCREVHVVSYGNECKELLIWMDRDWKEDYSVTAIETDIDGKGAEFTFMPQEEKDAVASYTVGEHETGYLFEPGKSLMKAGAFNLISRRFGLTKLGASTHYYLTTDEETAERLRNYGKTYRILKASRLDKRSIKEAGKEYPNSEVTARNIPMDTDTLRKKLGTKSGDIHHIFGLRSDSQGPMLFVTEAVRK